MAGELRNTPNPSLGFRFTVALGDGLTGFFQEIEGLEPAVQANAYRPEASPPLDATTGAIPHSGGQVMLRNGVFAKDDAFWSFYNAMKMNTSARQTVLIKLRDEEPDSGPTWTLNGAWPTRISGAELSSTGGSEVVVESLEIAYTTLVVNP